MSRPRLWLARTLLVGASAAVAILVVEVALRLLDLFPVKSGYERFVEHHPERGWHNVPGATGWYTTDEVHIHLAFNAHGYRGPATPREKAPGTRRIVMLGDSFVEGFMVALDDRVSNVLERILDAERSRGESPSTEVVALGTSGYGTDQQLLWLESEGMRYDPDVVVLMFYYNDIWYNAQSTYTLGGKPRYVLEDDSLRLTNVPVPPPVARPANRGAAPRRAAQWIARSSRLGAAASRGVKGSPALHRLAARLGIAELPSEVGAGTGGRSRPDEFLVFEESPPPAVEEAWRVTEALLARMDTVTRSAGATFVVFYIPFRSRVHHGAAATREDRALPGLARDRVAERLLSACMRLGVRCVEPTARFVHLADSLGREGRRLYFTYDWHWTPEGNRAAAELLADSLRADITGSARVRRDLPRQGN